MGLLRGFSEPEPSAELAARVRAAVGREARRLSRAGVGGWGLAVGWAAAAILLPVALLAPLRALHEPTNQPRGAMQSLADWDAAIERTADILTTLVDEAWLPDGAEETSAGDPLPALDDYYDCLSRAVDLGA